MKKRSHAINTVWTVILTILSLAWVYPVVVVLINSFKKDSAISTSTAFQLPPADGFAGLGNYANAIHSKGFLAAFFNSFIISVTSVVLILVCCSMCAWFITRVKTWATKLCYFLFVFSMVEIEEAAMIDGCGPLRTFFLVVMPMLKPTLVSVGILETMWVWNDYLLPYLVLDGTKYMTIPILIQYFRGGFGRVEMGPMMACIVLTILPIIIIYVLGQKHIIKGVAAGAVKG